MTLRTIPLIILSLFYCGGALALDDAKSPPPDAPRRVMFIFAHQDDEVCISARIKTDVAAGRKVDIVWITNGDKAGDAAVREKESRAAIAFLGVPPQGLHYLGYEDQESYKIIKEAFRKTLAIARTAAPDAIFSNAYEGGNIDHDTAHFIAEMVARALPSHPPHYEFPLYNSYKGTYNVMKFIPRNDTRTLSTPMDEALIAIKIKLLDFYPSQKALFNVMRPLVNKRKLKKDGESYRLVTDYDYLKPPTAGTLGYELNNNRIPHKFEEFKAAVLDFYNSADNPATPMPGPKSGK